MLTKQQVLELLDCTEASLKEWRKAGVFSPSWFVENYDGHSTAYAPQVVVMGELLAELKATFGPKSPVAAEVCRAMHPHVNTLWRAAEEGRPHGVNLRYEGRRGIAIEVLLTFVNRAWLKLARQGATA